MTPQETDDLVRWVLNLPAERRRQRNLDLMRQAPLIDLELVSACNIVCRFCPRTEMQRTARRMTEETFAAVERLLPADAVLMLSGLGESLLHPQLPDWVARLGASGHPPCLITNGVALTPERQDALFAAGLSQVQVSVHSLDLDTARRVVPRGARPDRVRRYLERLSAERPEALRVRINFVETPDNGADRAAVAAWAHDLGFDFYFRREHTRGGSLGAPEQPPIASGCGIFAAVTFITADGDVLPCVNDVRGDHALGNVRDLRWADIEAWKRSIIRDGAWFAPCEGCNDDYRWVLIGQGQLDEPAALKSGSLSPS